eukprot:TRINITY_DN28993_c0_g1_i1.p1 TRINITY_DN28993_c0_g1~~TRINITY_DN28993_c0_g1_i1.p1  ORF type:complete len:246 (+),score=27.01 TRINITY_DN28993_c0_g1_i1:98-835(+)
MVLWHHDEWLGIVGAFVTWPFMMTCGIQYSIPFLIVAVCANLNLMLDCRQGWEWIDSWKGLAVAISLMVLEFSLAVIPVVNSFAKLASIPVKLLVAITIYLAVDNGENPKDPIQLAFFAYTLSITVFLMLFNAAGGLVAHAATLHIAGPCLLTLETATTVSLGVLTILIAPVVFVVMSAVAFMLTCVVLHWIWSHRSHDSQDVWEKVKHHAAQGERDVSKSGWFAMSPFHHFNGAGNDERIALVS